MNKSVLPLVYILLAGIVPSVCLGATAAPAISNADDQRAGYTPGRGTRDWLALQREGTRAGAAQPLPGPAATLLYQRYLNSFKNPIPAMFDDKAGAGDASR